MSTTTHVPHNVNTGRVIRNAIIAAVLLGSVVAGGNALLGAGPDERPNRPSVGIERTPEELARLEAKIG